MLEKLKKLVAQTSLVLSELQLQQLVAYVQFCLLYTSDAADE